MALIKCAQCGGVVSTKAKACPHCNVDSAVVHESPLDPGATTVNEPNGTAPTSSKGASTKFWGKVMAVFVFVRACFYLAKVCSTPWWPFGHNYHHTPSLDLVEHFDSRTLGKKLGEFGGAFFETRLYDERHDIRMRIQLFEGGVKYTYIGNQPNKEGYRVSLSSFGNGKGTEDFLFADVSFLRCATTSWTDHPNLPTIDGIGNRIFFDKEEDRDKYYSELWTAWDAWKKKKEQAAKDMLRLVQ